MPKTPKERFLVAYAELRTVAAAARKAAIGRTTVYRWRADPAFVRQMDAAWELGYRRWLVEVYAPTQRERERARQQRNAELRAARQQQAERMRAARRTRTAGP